MMHTRIIVTGVHIGVIILYDIDMHVSCTHAQAIATMHMHTTISCGLLLEVNVREQLTEFENDGVTVILEWDEH